MGFWLGEVEFLALVKVAGPLDGVLAEWSLVLALVKVARALEGVLAG
jgi:hypothetical protein